jgi:hypothetical protein
MADLSVTAASVAPGSNAVYTTEIAGAAITAGQAVYLDPTDGKVKLADANSATASVRTVSGIAISGAANGSPVIVQRSGDITIGASTTAGVIYCLSGTAGGIMPAADIATGIYVGIIGVGIGSSQIRLGLNASGIVA